MKAAIHLFLITALSCTGIALGCDGDDEQTTTGTTTTGTTTTTTDTGNGGGGGGGTGGGGGGTNANLVPQLGTQVDRMGRPAINTALNNTFQADQAVKDEQKDVWNQTTPDQWATFTPEVAANLGILDSLDANCGNQLLAGPDAVAGRYDTLANILANDRLWLKLDALTCEEYLGVEAAAVGAPINDCGGRRLADDVVERSYSVLAAGVLSGIDDTIDAEPGKTSGDAFPFLAPAQ
jgi:hypothetical protein